jgi:hypothetical protein
MTLFQSPTLKLLIGIGNWNAICYSALVSTEIRIHDIFKTLPGGGISHFDLLCSEMSIVFWCAGPPSPQTLVRLAAPDFQLDVRFSGSSLDVERNGHVASVPYIPGKMHFFVFAWSTKKLIACSGLHADETGDHELRQIETETPFTVPPIALSQWARRENLAPVSSYGSSEELCWTITNAFEGGVLEKVKDVAAQKAFWDFRYGKNGKIVSRKPKNETSIHPTIHALLYDISLQKGLEIFPEPRVGGGNLDFMFVGSLNDGGVGTVCVEVKNAHSPDIINGVANQRSH